MPATHFSGPVKSSNGINPGTTTVADAPSASMYPAGTMIYVSDGAAGGPIIAFSDGAAWLRCDTGAAVSAV